MAKVLVSAISIKQQNAISNQITGFTNAHFATGCSSGTTTAVNMRNYNRTLSYSTETESSRTDLATTARIAQGAGGFSSTDIYLIKGFTGSALSNDVNKVSASTNSNSVPTITFSTQRRGPYIHCPVYLKRIYFIGGFSTVYTKLVTYIDTSTDTPTNTTDVLDVIHVGNSLYTKSYSYLIAGYTTGDALTSGVYRLSFSTDTTITLGNLSTTTALSNSLSYYTFGYLVGGTNRLTNTTKFRYSTETFSAGANLDERLEASVPSVTNTKGYVWTGYRTTLSRALYIISWATETITNASYTTGDANTGWLQQSAGA